MAGPTAAGLATCTLVLLPFAAITWVLRFYVRLSRKAWGPDDWSMVAAIPLFAVSTTGMLGIAWTGGGLTDAQLVDHPEKRRAGMFWWFIMETMWCLAAIPIKWAICFTLLRIANRKIVYLWSTYVVMAAVFMVMASTTIYEFCHCTPVRMNWEAVPGGSCKAQSNITGFSYALSAVSIFSDWYCALIPIPLLWGVQMDGRIKLSVIALLGLGVFASVAALVRLTITVNLSSTSDFLFHAMDVAAWAQVELSMGVIVANLPALRPLLEKILSLRSTIRSKNTRSRDKLTTGGQTDQYLELEEGAVTKSQTASQLRSKKGLETRIYGDLDRESETSSVDDNSQKNIVAFTHRSGAQQHGISVERTVEILSENAAK